MSLNNCNNYFHNLEILLLLLAWRLGESDCQFLVKVVYDDTELVITEADQCYTLNDTVQCTELEVKYGYSAFFFPHTLSCKSEESELFYDIDPEPSSLTRCPVPDIWQSVFVTSVMPSGSYGISPDAADDIVIPGSGLCVRINMTADVTYVSQKEGYNHKFFTSENCSEETYVFTFGPWNFQSYNYTQAQLNVGDEKSVLDAVNSAMYYLGRPNPNASMIQLLRSARSALGIRVQITSTTVAQATEPATPEPKDYATFYFTMISMFIFFNALCCVGIWGIRKHRNQSRRKDKNNMSASSFSMSVEEDVVGTLPNGGVDASVSSTETVKENFKPISDATINPEIVLENSKPTISSDATINPEILLENSKATDSSSDAREKVIEKYKLIRSGSSDAKEKETVIEKCKPADTRDATIISSTETVLDHSKQNSIKPSDILLSEAKKSDVNYEREAQENENVATISEEEEQGEKEKQGGEGEEQSEEGEEQGEEENKIKNKNKMKKMKLNRNETRLNLSSLINT